MKSQLYGVERHRRTSRPARGAWVEIKIFVITVQIFKMSRPARGAWVEITAIRCGTASKNVAPRKGRVG